MVWQARIRDLLPKVPEVLNALRHQWFGRRSEVADGVMASPVSCSTPCGISGLAGTCIVLFLRLPQRCSTPCGISGLAGCRIYSLSWVSVLCSTPWRHQVVWQVPFPFSSNSAFNGAQRLGGISGLAGHSKSRFFQCSSNGCSTPCGISGLAGVRG